MLAQDNFWQTPSDEKPGRTERKKAAPAPVKKAPAAPAAKPAEGSAPAAAGAAGQAPAADAAPSQQPAAAPPSSATAPVSPAAPPAASSNAIAEQETAFWNSIKDSASADEFKAYLKKYPKGTFAELAQIKIKQLTQSPAAAPGALPQPSAAAPNPTFSASMKEAQERLYGLNYDIGRFDGIPDERTERAIRAWQQRVGYPATGVITLTQLARLRQLPPVKVWGAIAFASLNGAAVVVTEQPTRAKAESKALADCLAKAGRACNAFAVPETRCGALAYFRQRLTTGNFSVTQAIGQDVTIPGATARALSSCNKSQDVAGRCGILASTCANGQGHVYAPAFSDAPVPPPVAGAQGGSPPFAVPAPQQPQPARPMRRPGEQDT